MGEEQGTVAIHRKGLDRKGQYAPIRSFLVNPFRLRCDDLHSWFARHISTSVTVSVKPGPTCSDFGSVRMFPICEKP